MVYPTIIYNRGLFVSLHRDNSTPTSKPFPLETQVIDIDPDTNASQLGTVMDIPLDPNTSPHYLIQFDDGATSLVPANKMPL
jgi:hypothetical protein